MIYLRERERERERDRERFYMNFDNTVFEPNISLNPVK